MHTDSSQMVLIPEELMWFVGEGQTQCPREKTLSHPGGARRGWLTLLHCPPPTEDDCGIWGELGPQSLGTGEVKASPTRWPKPTLPHLTGIHSRKE